MLTVAEITVRAKQVWGETATVTPWLRSDNDRWCVVLPKSAVLHYLDRDGGIVCRHSSCLVLEVPR